MLVLNFDFFSRRTSTRVQSIDGRGSEACARREPLVYCLVVAKICYLLSNKINIEIVTQLNSYLFSKEETVYLKIVYTLLTNQQDFGNESNESKYVIIIHVLGT